MVQIKILIILLLSISETICAKISFNRMKLSEKSYQNENYQVKRCDELSPVMLNDILGAAFNSR